jgi:chitinase
MRMPSGCRAFVASLLLAAPLAGAVVIDEPAAWASTASAGSDTTPPSTPTNLRQIGMFGGQVVLGWDAATDNSQTIRHYWVRADGGQIYRPSTTSVRVSDLVRFCHLLRGHTYAMSIQAVDPSLNRSAPTAPIRVTIF